MQRLQHGVSQLGPVWATEHAYLEVEDSSESLAWRDLLVCYPDLWEEDLRCFTNS